MTMLSFFTDPRIRDSSYSILGKLIKNTKTPGLVNFESILGRSIVASHQAGHEIYFLIDISASISDDDLTTMVDFCVKLTNRVSFLMFVISTKFCLCEQF